MPLPTRKRVVVGFGGAVDRTISSPEQNAVHRIRRQVEVAEVGQVIEAHARLDDEPWPAGAGSITGPTTQRLQVGEDHQVVLDQNTIFENSVATAR